MPGGHQVIKCAETLVQRRGLKCTRNAKVRYPMGWQPGDILTIKEDLASVYLVEIVDTVQQGSFTGSVWANDGKDFTLMNIETNIGQSLCTPKAKENFIDA